MIDRDAKTTIEPCMLKEEPSRTAEEQDPPLPPLIPQAYDYDRDAFLDQEDSAEFVLVGHPGTER